MGQTVSVNGEDKKIEDGNPFQLSPDDSAFKWCWADSTWTQTWDDATIDSDSQTGKWDAVKEREVTCDAAGNLMGLPDASGVVSSARISCSGNDDDVYDLKCIGQNKANQIALCEGADDKVYREENSFGCHAYNVYGAGNANVDACKATCEAEYSEHIKQKMYCQDGCNTAKWLDVNQISTANKVPTLNECKGTETEAAAVPCMDWKPHPKKTNKIVAYQQEGALVKMSDDNIYQFVSTCLGCVDYFNDALEGTESDVCSDITDETECNNNSPTACAFNDFGSELGAKCRDKRLKLQNNNHITFSNNIEYQS